MRVSNSVKAEAVFLLSIALPRPDLDKCVFVQINLWK